MSFNRPTLSELIERARSDIEARLPGADSRLRHSVLDVLARTHAGAAAGLHGHLDWIARQILPDTADAEQLARHASIWGVARKAATPATGLVTVRGENGRFVPAGSELVRADGRRYRITADALIEAGGTIDAAAEAIEAGAAGAMGAGQRLTFAVPIVGIQAQATVAAAGLGGAADEEADEDLRARLILRIQEQPSGGRASDYRGWALDVPGVTRAWVFPQWMGIGTVGVAFVMDGRPDIIPLPADVDDVQAAIDAVRPVTATAIVFAPTPVEVPISISAAPADAATRAAIVAEIADLFARDAEPGGIIRLSRLSEAVSIAAGERYHRIERPTEDFIAPPGRLPVPGEVEWV